MQKIIGTVEILPQQIRGKIKPTVASSGEEYQKGYSEGYSKGREFLKYVTNLASTFSLARFPKNTELVLDCPNIISLNSAFFDNDGIEKLVLKGNIENKTVDGTNAFRGTEMVIIDLSEFNCNIARAINMFSNSYYLKIILGEIDLSNCTNAGNMFNYTEKLEEVRFKKGCIKLSISFQHCSMLSDASASSIKNGLVDLTGGTAQTIQFHATVKNKLTAEQKAQITSKNWTLA